MIKTVGIVGAGALGVLYGLQFQKKIGRENVYMLADGKRIDKYTKESIFANDVLCDFQYVEGKGSPVVDLLIFTVKQYDLVNAVSMAKGACGKNTIVMSFLNGVTSEEIIEQSLDPERILYSTVQGMDATKIENRLKYSKIGNVTIDENSCMAKDVKDFFDRTGIKYLAVDDIKHHMWSKWMLNVGVNQVCAAYGLAYGGVQYDGVFREIMTAAMDEARACAAAEGICLTEEERNNWIDVVDGLSPKGAPSMRQDTYGGRETEVELFAGTVRKLALKHGIEAPWNLRLYDIIKGNISQPPDYEHRVHYYETDQMGIVHHSNYVRWMEEARVAYLRKIGVPYRAMEELGIASPVIGVSCEYKHSVLFDSTVKIKVEIEKYTGLRLAFAYRITDSHTGQLCTTGKSQHCFVDTKGKPLSIKRKFPTLHRLMETAAGRVVD